MCWPLAPRWPQSVYYSASASTLIQVEATYLLNLSSSESACLGWMLTNRLCLSAEVILYPTVYSHSSQQAVLQHGYHLLHKSRRKMISAYPVSVALSSTLILPLSGRTCPSYTMLFASCSTQEHLTTYHLSQHILWQVGARASPW